MKTFGGSWTDQKLNAFIKYVKAYLVIINNYKKKYNWETIYFDGFAGFGEKLEKGKVNNLILNLFEFEEEKNETSVYKGSVSRILQLPKPYIFDWYYFIDTNEKYVNNLEKITSKINHIDKKKIIVRNEDCNKQLTELASKALSNKKYSALIFLDPFGMQVNWESISKLKNTRSDIWILIPSGVAINRLLDRKMKLVHSSRLEKFFGLNIQEIEKMFYRTYSHDTLFGKENIIKKIDDPITKISEIYILQLKKIWKHVTESPLILKNSKMNPIFHLLFATNNKSGLKIASEIIERGN